MSRLVVVGAACLGGLVVRKLAGRTSPPSRQNGDLYTRSTEVVTNITAAAGEAFPGRSTRAKVVDRRGSKLLLLLLLLAASTTLTALWAGVLSDKAAIICLTGIAATLWTSLLSGHLVSSGPLQEATRTNVHAMAGRWIKDKAASSSMDAALDLAGIRGILRKAICLLKGCEISFENEEFTFAVTSVLPWFKVIEKYPLDGETRQWRRRDLRRGKHTGYVEQSGNSIIVHLDWDDPVAGHGQDKMSSPTENMLVVESICHIQGESVGYRTVYYRA